MGFQNVYCLVVNGSNIFAGTNNGGVYVSTNNGASWTAENSGLGWSICLFLGGEWHVSLPRLVSVSSSPPTTGQAGTLDMTGMGYRGVYSLAVSGVNIFAGTGRLVSISPRCHQ